MITDWHGIQTDTLIDMHSHSHRLSCDPPQWQRDVLYSHPQTRINKGKTDTQHLQNIPKKCHYSKCDASYTMCANNLELRGGRKWRYRRSRSQKRSGNDASGRQSDEENSEKELLWRKMICFARAGNTRGASTVWIFLGKERVGGGIRAGSAMIQLLSLNSQSQMV